MTTTTSIPSIVLSKSEEQTDPLESDDTQPICIGLWDDIDFTRRGLRKWRVVMVKRQEVGFRDSTETEGVEQGYFESEFFAGERTSWNDENNGLPLYCI